MEELRDKILTHVSDDEMSRICLNLSITNDAEVAAELLFDPVFSIDQKLDGGYTFLYYASIFDATDVIELLLNVGANRDVVNDEGIKLSTWIRQYGSEKAISRFDESRSIRLTKFTRNIDYAKKLQRDLWNTATEQDPNGEKGFVDVLMAMENGNETDLILAVRDWETLYDGYTLLHLAMIYDNTRIAKHLVVHGLDQCPSGGRSTNVVPADVWARMYGSDEINDLFPRSDNTR